MPVNPSRVPVEDFCEQHAPAPHKPSLGESCQGTPWTPVDFGTLWRCSVNAVWRGHLGTQCFSTATAWSPRFSACIQLAAAGTVRMSVAGPSPASRASPMTGTRPAADTRLGSSKETDKDAPVTGPRGLHRRPSHCSNRADNPRQLPAPRATVPQITRVLKINQLETITDDVMRSRLEPQILPIYLRTGPLLD